MSDKQPAVVVKDLYKSFKLPHEQHNGIKQLIVNFAKRKKGYEVQHVLDDVSFEIQKGEFFGIVGRNGSGKSTLLKLLAGIYVPDKGLVQVNGSLTPFIELGVGFNPELTGRENVFLNGALLGFSKPEMEKMYDDIVEFAELEKFMDQKLKNYSSGMQVRLAFSIAIRAQSDILLLDEVLAVGDEAFQRKCYEYFNTLKRNKKTVILVTHDMNAIRSFCSKAIVVEKGRIIESGTAEYAANTYTDLLNPKTEEKEIIPVTEEKKNRWGDHYYSFENVSVSVEDPNVYNAPIHISADIKCTKNINEDLIVAYAVKDDKGQVVFGDKYTLSALRDMDVDDKLNMSVAFGNILNKGKYFIDLSIYNPSSKTYNDIWLDCGRFRTTTITSNGFTVRMPSKFTISAVKEE